ncbi:kinase rad3 [Nannizzia gypsea CBS 118893]|uniref:Serine/threonine-protein kinase MEC1 n=1 Tax=Arthroderma gypseum (strain ATCC MYA-4604 / CBS 118893) TaxID=535722 RepID=E4V606_ARTGP|nr:kinase rad3 [Nannizzia gypsea CBS 118893]EFR05531.1 kinase rad3 [Nannizzia gypsea CBS 118893]
MASQNGLQSRRSLGKQREAKARDAPVSSLIPSHLASHLAADTSGEYGIDRETFSQLRREILSQGEDDKANTNDNINDIYNLICVVLKAGLEQSLKTQGVRTSGEDIMGQTLDCLDIIRLAVQRAPAVLKGNAKPGFLKENTPQSPLFVWVLSPLLTLLCSWDDRSIQDKVCQVISVLYGAQFKTIELCYSVKSISRFLQACVGELVHTIETANIPCGGVSPCNDLYFPVPTVEFLSRLDELGLPRNCCSRNELGNPQTVAMACLRLIETISCPIELALADAKAAFLRESFNYGLHLAVRLWKTVLGWFDTNTVALGEESLSSLLVEFVSLSRKLCTYSTRLSSRIDQRVLHLLFQCVVDLVDTEQLKGSIELQQVLAEFLMEVIRLSQSFAGIEDLVEELFFCPLSDINANLELFQRLHQSLQHVVLRVLAGEHRTKLRSKVVRRVGLCDKDRGSTSRSHALDESNFPMAGLFDTSTDERARKRPRLSNKEDEDAHSDLSSVISNQIYTTLGVFPPNGLEDLDEDAMHDFSSLPPSDKCIIITNMGRLACVWTKSLSGEEYGNIAGQTYTCKVCDCETEKGHTKKPISSLQFGHLRNIFAGILPRVKDSGSCRIAAMVAIRNIINHDLHDDEDRLDISPFGEYCLQSLKSSIRELRVAAGKTIVSFLRGSRGSDIRCGNFVVALEYLHKIFEKNELYLQETCVMALRQIAEISNDEEMNIVLLRLLEYLGHANPFVSGIAYTEISKLATLLRLTPAALFRPFWRTLSLLVIKNFQARPQIADELCDLLGMEVNGFLRLTTIYTLPYLVLTRKKDIITRIAMTHSKKSVSELIKTRSHLASILALLLVQPFPNPETAIPSILQELSVKFNDPTLSKLVRSECVPITCELLRGLGGSGEGKGSKYYDALEYIASVTPRQAGRGVVARIDNLSVFIEEHVLGVVTEFVHVINDFQVLQPIPEKKRDIIAMGEMIKIAKGNISIALPQICACLRSALDSVELRDHAFATWNIMILALNDIDLEPLIGQTFALILKYWNFLTEESKKREIELVDYILNDHKDTLVTVSETLPSLESIPELSEQNKNIEKLKQGMDIRSKFMALCRRCQSDNFAVVERALLELLPNLTEHEEFIHGSMFSEQPDKSLVGKVTRTLLDCCVKYNSSSPTIVSLCAQCLGLIGCLDPNRIESIKEKREIVVLSNFERSDETLDFIIFCLQNILVDAFLAASNSRTQGFLAYAMQALLTTGNLSAAIPPRSQDPQSSDLYRRWLELPELSRNTLTPFLNSKYSVTIGAISTSCHYPLFTPALNHSEWLKTFVLDMLQKGKSTNIQILFSVFSRIIRTQEKSISVFLLPFAALNVAVSSVDEERENLKGELTNILECPLPDHKGPERENLILFSESVFAVLDYLSRWLHGKKKEYTSITSTGNHASRSQKESLTESAVQIKRVEHLLACIPAEIISKRAVECKSYARALFHWEQYIRQQKSRPEIGFMALQPLYQRLQDIYTQIDEPDGIDGISSRLHVLDLDQQLLEHRNSGRWAAAQSWYELQLNKSPKDLDTQINLLTCLKESGQYGVLLNQYDSLKKNEAIVPKMLPFAIESSWVTGKWGKLEKLTLGRRDEIATDFNIGIGAGLVAFRQGKKDELQKIIEELRMNVATGFTPNSVATFQASHDGTLKLHILSEIELLTSGSYDDASISRNELLTMLDRRLDMLGGCISDKQYVLGIRQAIMDLSPAYDELEVASVWQRIAKLARKANWNDRAFNAVVHSAQLNDKTSTIEYARLLWKEGLHRKAIQTLDRAIAARAFGPYDRPETSDNDVSVLGKGYEQNILIARAFLLLAKWMDRAGQTQSDYIVSRYRQAIHYHSRWEKAHYYLGKHYTKILDSEKSKPLGKEGQKYLSGEASKLVINSYLRSLTFGNKYVSQTLPKVLTLWLEHAAAVDQPFDPKRGDNEDFQRHNMSQRRKNLDEMHSQLKKYTSRISPALLFTILPQVVARICQSNTTVYNTLTSMIVKPVVAFPQQGLWTVLALRKSSSKDRLSRGITILQKIIESSRRAKTDHSAGDIRSIINQGQKFSDELLELCLARIEERTPKVSLSETLRFNHRVAPCRLAIPLEATLTPTLPSSHEPHFLKTFRAFPADTITIETVLDEALILSSLQKPRKISIRGSDGKIYGLLCKPKDDLRKDQRLMEFNSMINRFLMRDLESNKRRLYIKTYAVTPLNEECGLIEWVDNLRTLREIVTKLLKERGVSLNYQEIRRNLDEACADDSNLTVFTDKVLARYPPVLHEWFVETFPEPATWFAARLKYTRSSAVMSMVGYSLGLGDRHGENMLFEEATGGILHVDFNCLFDKGLTFDKPELVPFRLTHNMIDAYGAYGYNGPFRKSCELTLDLLRQNEDSLMTILETFLHDPTTDFIGKKKRHNPRVPDTPEGVLELVRNKLRGLLPGESVPLSVAGHVDALILQATSVKNLAAMYVGWCAFF